MANLNPFYLTGSTRPGRSVFNLSHSVKFDMDMGPLVPVLIQEAVPGDVFRMSNRVVVRAQPLVAPILHEVNINTYTFFAPYRLLFDQFEEFITGGVTGETSVTLPRYVRPGTHTKYSLWDYFGFPIDVDPPEEDSPLAFPWLAYNMIWNEFFRDQNLQQERDGYDNSLAYKAWTKDYFTSALPWQQRGSSPSLPLAGSTSAVWSGSFYTGNSALPDTEPVPPECISRVINGKFQANESGDWVDLGTTYHLHLVDMSNLNNNTVNLSGMPTFDVNDLRTVFQLQKWAERNARAGVRYTEFLQAHYGVSPRDARLQRPEFIGATQSPLIVSEVLQTSSTDTTSPQGNLAGHGITADANRIGSYRVEEFGIIMTVMCIVPKPAYQQGINRQWMRRTRYDFYSPEFAHLSEQGIETSELYLTDDHDVNSTLFGYQGRYNEMRYASDRIAGSLRDTLDYWHLGRKFDDVPLLNGSFITMTPSKRIFAVQDEPGFIVSYGNNITAVRPLPVIAEPGLIDHF